MSAATAIAERTPIRTSLPITSATIAALALLSGAATAMGGISAPPPPTLTLATAQVAFPSGGPIPPEVARSAQGGLSPDGLLAKFTGGLGPISRNAFVLNAPQGAAWAFGGGIIGGVTPGVGICIAYDILIEFTGGKVNYGINQRAQVPNAGSFTDGSSGQLLDSDTISGTAQYFFVAGAPNSGTYSFDFNIDWVSARPSDTLTVTINSVAVNVCVIPSPGATGVLGLAAMAGPARRRRR
jgi:hypothetical protein